jgi:hypothetical protein
MEARYVAVVALSAMLAACGGPAPLGYGLPSPTDVGYTYSDTTLVSISALGQSMELSIRAVADYRASFTPEPGGIGVSLTVDDLDASVALPMASPMQVDESAIQGALVFTVDRLGNATVVSLPEIDESASQLVSGVAIAHSFLPGLPDRVVAPGDTWTDTVSYDVDELGGSAESVLRYTVVGDTAVDGRALLNISLAGTQESSNSLNVGGMQIEQASSVEVEGHVLWDDAAGLPYEMVRSGSGQGTVSVPISPQPIPIQLTTMQRIRLRM